MYRTILFPGLMAVSLAACQSADRPSEFTTAEEAIGRAEDADLDNSMPRAMELAQRKYSEAKQLLSQSEKALENDDITKGEDLRRQSIAAANEAIAIVDAGLNLRDDVKAFDSNLVVTGGTDQALMSENRNLRSQIERLRLQAAEGKGLQEFEIEKDVAFFETNSTKITPAFATEIASVAATMKAHPELYLTLEGFADPRGTKAYNQKLSEQRAEAVMTRFVEEGISADRIRMAGRGETGTPTKSLARLQLDRKVVAKFSTVAH
jgi:outer membrane protein OmpA-like peptidoglycan-associated protein